MSRDIVCGVDLPSGSTGATLTAAALARALVGRAVLAHVMDPTPGPPEGGLPSLRRARHLGRLRAIAEALELPYGTTVDVLAGEPAHELLKAATERDAELIVLGSRGLLEAGSARRGGMADALMRAAPCPVVVVPPHATVAPDIRTIVCAVEGSRTDVDLLRLVGDLARRLSATVRAVHSFSRRATPPGIEVSAPFETEQRDAPGDRLRQAIAEAAVDARPSVLALPPAQALIRAAEEEGAGLIAVASQARGRLDPVLLGSLSLQLAAKAPVPVLVLPPRAELRAGSGHYELAAEAA
jgi:nucleotide-binding universal stress UspA family protein